jgi:hypothetical protein
VSMEKTTDHANIQVDADEVNFILDVLFYYSSISWLTME